MRIKTKRIRFDPEEGFIIFEENIEEDMLVGTFCYFTLDTSNSSYFLRKEIIEEIDKIFKEKIKIQGGSVIRRHGWDVGTMKINSPTFVKKNYSRVLAEVIPLLDNVDSYVTENDLKKLHEQVGLL